MSAADGGRLRAESLKPAAEALGVQTLRTCGEIVPQADGIEERTDPPSSDGGPVLAWLTT